MPILQRPPADEELESTRLRLTFLALVTVLLFALLLGRLWYLQVMAGERYVELAQGNAVRTVALVAPRGEIYDADGELLVGNEFVNVVSIQPGEIPEDRVDDVFADLADLLGISVREMQRRITSSTVSSVRPKPVGVDVPEDVILYIWENQSTRYPGVYAERLPQRRYPQETLAAHVVGYTGQISQQELESPAYSGYRAGEQIGWGGVERSYESVLHGTEGLRDLEVDARNRVVRQINETLPEPGADLYLTIDTDIQAQVEQALRDGIKLARRTEDVAETRQGGTFEAPAGAVVVLRPTGEVVAMASYPTFDPGQFVGGVSGDYYSSLLDTDNHLPLFNRAVQAAYPPGSVWKPISASAAMRNGYMTTGTELPCPAVWEYNGGKYRNWAEFNMGSMDVAESLEQSCDTIYYELARRMFEDEVNTGADVEFMSQEARAWAMGQQLGVDLPGEEDGVVPGREWRRKYWERTRDSTCAQAEVTEDGDFRTLLEELCSEQGARWRGGDAVNMSIGQGDVQTTPLQIAVAYAAIANGGTLYRPHVGKHVRYPNGTQEPIDSEVIGELNIDPRYLEEIRAGLEQVTSPGGTADSVFGDFPIATAGKTGTAEAKPKQPFSWYAAYAPADNPEYVVVSVVEQGGGGSRVSAPIARRVLEHLFDLPKTPFKAGEVTE